MPEVLVKLAPKSAPNAEGRWSSVWLDLDEFTSLQTTRDWLAADAILQNYVPHSRALVAYRVPVFVSFHRPTEEK